MTGGDVSGTWQDNARDWLAWARTPGQDSAFWEMNLPALAEVLPPPGLGTVDVACGEGRVGRELADCGHRVWGLDVSELLVEAARAAGGYEEVTCGDATALPWAADSFDLAIAFMCLMDMPDPAAAIDEIARVLIPGGRLCVAITHPLNGPTEFLENYFVERGSDVTIEIGELSMQFVARQRPIEHYTRALAAAGFVIEEFREPRPSAEAVAHSPRLAAAARRPWTLLIRARLDR